MARGYQTGFVGENDCLGAVAEFELGEEACDMGLHGAFGYPELAGDFLIAEASTEEPKHLELAFGQLLEAWDRVAGHRRCPASCGVVSNEATED